MNVYCVTERVRKPSIEAGCTDEFVNQDLFILAESAAEVMDMLKSDDYWRQIRGVNLVCSLTCFSDAKYEVVPRTEWGSQSEDEPEVSEDVLGAMEVLESVERILCDEKHRLVSLESWGDASELRDAQSMVRNLLDRPNSLEELFREQSADELLIELHELADAGLEELEAEGMDASFYVVEVLNRICRYGEGR